MLVFYCVCVVLKLCWVVFLVCVVAVSLLVLVVMVCKVLVMFWNVFSIILWYCVLV